MQPKDEIYYGLLKASPNPAFLLTGKELIISVANDATLKAWGRDSSIIGLPFTLALPELNNQPFESILQEVLFSGKAYSAIAGKADLITNGILETFYFNYMFQPMLDENGMATEIMCFATDVTETENSKRRAEESEKQMKFAEKQLRFAMEGARLGTWQINSKDKKIEYSNSLNSLFGYEGGICLDYEKVGDQLDPIHQTMIREALENANLYNLNFDITYPQRRFDNGEIIWLRSIGAPSQNPDGSYDMVSGIIIDVTDQVLSKQHVQKLNDQLASANEELIASNEELLSSAEDLIRTQADLEQTLIELKRSESRLRFLLSEAPIAIAVMTGRNMTIESANKKVLDAWGKDEHIIGLPLIEAVPELKGQNFLNLLDDVFTSGKPYFGNEVKALLEQKGKIEEVYSNFVYWPLKDEKGITNGIMLTANVVTEQVVERQKAQHAEEMLRHSITAARIGTFMLDTKSYKLVASPRLNELFGYGWDEEMTFENAVAQIAEEDRERVISAITESIQTSKTYDIEYRTIGFHDQKLRWVRANGGITQSEEDGNSHFFGSIIEITEQKLDEQRKSDFIGMVSHEMKTPITSVTAYLQVAQRLIDKENPALSNALEKSLLQVKKMTTMINGFLDMSRLESGKIHIEKVNFDMAQLVLEIDQECQATISSHKLIFAPVEFTPVSADKDKIGHVISNFISNAVKYSSIGSTIKVACVTEGGNALVSVMDEGIGIAQSERSKLFDRYYRVQSLSTGTISGFGIGLYLCSEIISRHNGQIWVNSIEGKGSTFHFSIPIIQQ